MAGCAVAVVGAGKMGLPLACQLAANGAKVTACDINPQVVATINDGRMPFSEPGVETLLRAARIEGRLAATLDLADSVAASDVVIIIVPVLLTPDSGADLSTIEEVTSGVARALRPGTLVCYETTVPVGTTRNRFAPMLESGGLRAGDDFDVAFSPERVKSQHVLEHLTRIPKIVGGINQRSADRAGEFYHRYLGAPIMCVNSLEAAEYAKLAGMLYRDLNIALANELAAYAEALDIPFEEVRSASNTDGEAAILAPGIGVGGHCTPVYPHFAMGHARTVGTPLALNELARGRNESQPRRLLNRVEEAGIALRGRTVLILGLAFRPEVKEAAFSPAFSIRSEAEDMGARIVLHDPMYTAEEITKAGFTPAALDHSPLPEIVVLNTAHFAYNAIDFRAWHKRGVRCVVDGRNTWSPTAVSEIGLYYVAPGVATVVPWGGTTHLPPDLD